MRRTFLTVALILILSTAAWAEEDERLELLQKSVQVMEEIINSPDYGIPTHLISNAKAIIIFPTMVKGGFIFATMDQPAQVQRSGNRAPRYRCGGDRSRHHQRQGA